MVVEVEDNLKIIIVLEEKLDQPAYIPYKYRLLQLYLNLISIMVNVGQMLL
jgi:hypothetical protein